MPLDEDVVAAIYRDHGPALRRFVLSASGDLQLADDVVQETILRVWQQAPDITGSLRSCGSKCCRAVIEQNVASARRLHFWRLPDGSIELSRVVVHDDFKP